MPARTFQTLAAATHFNVIYEADFIQTFHAHFRMHLVVFYEVISYQTLS